MAPKQGKESVVGDTYLGTIGSMACYTCTLRGGLTDVDSNWRLWNADMKVYRDGEGKYEDEETFPSIDDEVISKIERRRKAILWFSVSEAVREKFLTDMGSRDKTSEDVMRRLFDNVAPEGSKYKPLERFVVEDHMRESIRRERESKRVAENGQGKS
ncbi:uncharacterized protein RAG0_01737 [Rhynchosporium agropyri]|uniref:Uncharacterized protein n=1 Tax=Rhynchosporium agropyri TaxID=914238 RepID=A0A1E1K2T2_9HELO|nr:uncharacterized protein RAG0_01737 [Rhynchosporium agropyri]